jgi:hypothetical protein
MANQYIDVKNLKTLGGRTGGCTFIVIEIMLDETTGDKYFYVEDDMDHTSEIKVYKYPDVNEQIYAIMNMIESQGGSYFDDNRYLYGPHLTRSKVTELRSVGFESYPVYGTINREDIISKDTYLESHGFYENLISST